MATIKEKEKSQEREKIKKDVHLKPLKKGNDSNVILKSQLSQKKGKLKKSKPNIKDNSNLKFICKECKRSFKSKAALKSHSKAKEHNIKPKTNLRPKAKKKTKNSSKKKIVKEVYKCSNCGGEFKSQARILNNFLKIF